MHRLPGEWAGPRSTESFEDMGPTLAERVVGVLGLAAELGLLLLLIRAFSVESATFARIFAVAVLAFPVHALLPPRARLPFFVAVSLFGIWMLFGPTQAAWIVGLGSVLIGLAHLPVPFPARVALIVVVASVLALFRGGLWPSPWSVSVWPIFGAMFMFRLIIYLYDLKNRAAPTGFWMSFAYFFMLPNLCFPLFPVVDYKNFCRGHLKRPLVETSQRGMDMIFRGVVQLVLYRIVYQHLALDPVEVDSSAEAALYLVRPYLMYLKISGSFHIAVGMLHLFGFELPRTNHNYYLASSFTDYWRRINIYWKDFLQKIFFNPVYFALNRRAGQTTSLVLATAIAFIATWALHSYQWFWIRGSFPVVWQDMAFWGAMGVVVMVTMIHETRHGRKRTLGKPRHTWRSDLGVAARTLGTLLAIVTFWAVWSVGSWPELVLMVGWLLKPGPLDLLWIFGTLFAVGLAAIVYHRLGQDDTRKEPLVRVAGLRVPVHALRTGALSALLILAVYGQLYFYYPAPVTQALDTLRNPLRLSGADAQAMDRGYYEDLTDVARFNPELAALYRNKPPDWDRCFAIHRTGGFPTHELLPSRDIAFKGARMTTNSHGMRDREYTLTKPEGTYRIAITGASHTMGTGTEDLESFENVAEDRLNAEDGGGWELLNFAVGGYGPLVRLYDLQHRILDFEPDAFVTVGINDLHWAAKELVLATIDGLDLPWPEARAIADEADIGVGLDELTANSRMRPYREQLLRWIYREMVRTCREHGIVPIAAFIAQPRNEADDTRAQIQRQVDLAREEGMAVIDLLDVYEGVDLAELRLAPWDGHPNAQGHAMLADGLHDGIRRILDSSR